jgi:hypothetical protein
MLHQIATQTGAIGLIDHVKIKGAARVRDVDFPVRGQRGEVEDGGIWILVAIPGGNFYLAGFDVSVLQVKLIDIFSCADV